MITLVIGSEKDVSLSLQLQQALEISGCTASTFHPDLGTDATLPAHAMRVMQGAGYFIYLVTQYSQNAGYITMLTPENVAPLCAAGVRLILLVANGGSLPADLAYLPCLYFLDEEMLPVLIEGLAQALQLVDAIGPSDLYHLRYGARDLEAFLETAQGVAMAYGGLEGAWDEMQDHDEETVRKLFKRYTSDVSFGINFTSRLRLENRASQQADKNSPIIQILEQYKAIERDWLNIEMGFTYTDLMRANILAARCRTAIFINLIYLIMAIKLQPYCDQYLHMQGLKQKQEMHFPTGQAMDAAVERLSFLMSAASKKK